MAPPDFVFHLSYPTSPAVDRSTRESKWESVPVETPWSFRFDLDHFGSPGSGRDLDCEEERRGRCCWYNSGTRQQAAVGSPYVFENKKATRSMPSSTDYLDFIRRTARQLRKDEPVPRSLVQWHSVRKEIRSRLTRAIGLDESRPGDLPVRVVRKQQRDGYTIEHLLLGTFKTSAGQVWMTANAYVPKKDGPHPAVLCVHGHWSGAKQDPVVQSRCIGLAKLGFFVLSVDAIGAGERGLKEALGEYHGEMVAATLWPTGTLLAGLQVWENMRAVDYLQSRPEVLRDKIGITGTSGGGNQTIYAGALDDRFKCVVPVCSVGNYQAYLGAACCMCELVPGALTFTEEWQGREKRRSFAPPCRGP